MRSWIVGFCWAWGVAATAAPADDHDGALRALHRGDVVGALRIARPAAEAGHAPSQALLGFLLERSGADVEALPWYRRAADGGDRDGHFGLGNLLLAGRGIAKDEKQAFVHFSKAAASGHAAAIDLVAAAWIGARWGADPEADAESARAAVLRAARQGHLASAEALASAYRHGRLGLHADAGEAAHWQARAETWRRERAASEARPAAGRTGQSPARGSSR